MKVALILDFFTDFSKVNEYDYLIGVDKGAINAINHSLVLDLAVGDFDSVTETEFDVIKTSVKKIIKLDPIKDDTDTKCALNEAYKISNDVTILGGITGKRIEHFLANLNLLDIYPNLKIIDDRTLIFLKSESFYLDIKEYFYVNLFAKEEVKNLTLNGFKYNLKNYDLKPFDSLGISNEVIDKPFISFKSGKLLIILTKND